ncbi:MAG: hypothetical protein WD772_03995 [Pseudohongiellaceae bacterium]
MSVFFQSLRVVWLTVLLLPILLACGRPVSAHGSVVDEGDVCLLTLGFYSAHFTIYQPRLSKHVEFCEDIPEVTESIFVMEFEHQSLREVPVEFRIIRDRQERGRFVRWEDISVIGDLAWETVFYQPPAIHPHGVLMILHEFLEAGDYIGIVSTVHPSEDIEYHAVFPFHVGPPFLGYWPWIILILVLVQLNYWRMNRGASKLKEKSA